MLPIIEAFANGAIVEYYDVHSIALNGKRGMWKTAENIGFGEDPNKYRIIKTKNKNEQ